MNYVFEKRITNDANANDSECGEDEQDARCACIRLYSFLSFVWKKGKKERDKIETLCGDRDHRDNDFGSTDRTLSMCKGE